MFLIIVRANTMFKLVYQAFIMYSLIAGYIFYSASPYFLYIVFFFV